jgi:hypothetical protein
MIHELRTYDFTPRDAVRYLDLFRREGLPLITAYLPLIGYLVTETGHKLPRSGKATRC